MLVMGGSETAPCPVQYLKALLLELETKTEEFRVLVIELEAHVSEGSSDESSVLVIFIMRVYMTCRTAQDESIVIFEKVYIMLYGEMTTVITTTLSGGTIADEKCREDIFLVWASINQSLSDGGELLLKAREILLGSNLESLGELETSLLTVGGELEILFNETLELAKEVEMLVMGGSETAPCPVQYLKALLLELETKTEEFRVIVIELEAHVSEGSSDESSVLVIFIMRVYTTCRTAQDESIVIYESVLIIFSSTISDEKCREDIFLVWASINQSLSDGGELLLKAREILLGSNLESLGELETSLLTVGGELEILFNETLELAKEVEMLVMGGSETAPCPVQYLKALLLELETKTEEFRVIVIELEAHVSEGSSDESSVLVIFIMRVYMTCRTAQDESIVIFEKVYIMLYGEMTTVIMTTLSGGTIADEKCREDIFLVWASINQSLSDGGELLLKAREILLGSNLESLGELETSLLTVGGELEILFNETLELAKEVEMLVMGGSETAPCPVQYLKALLLELETKTEEFRVIVIELEAQVSEGSSDESSVLVIFIMRVYMTCRTAQDESIVIYESVLIIFSSTISDEKCREDIFLVWASINQSLSDGGELLLKAREILLGSNLESLGELETSLLTVGGELEILFNETLELAKEVEMLVMGGSETAPCPVQYLKALLLELETKTEEFRVIVIELEAQVSEGSSDESSVLVIFIMRVYMTCRTAQDESIVIYESVLIIFSSTISDEKCREDIFLVWASINQSLSDGGELLLKAREILLGSNLESLGELETSLLTVGGELEILFNETLELAKQVEMLVMGGSETAPCPVQYLKALLLELETKTEEFRVIVIELEAQVSEGSSDESSVLVIFIMRVYMTCRTAQDESIVIYESVLIIFSSTISDEKCREDILLVWASTNQSLSDGGVLMLKAREILLGSNLESLGNLGTTLLTVGGELKILFSYTLELAKEVEMLVMGGSETAPCPVQKMKELLLELETKTEELRVLVVEMEAQVSEGSADESSGLVIFIMEIYMTCRTTQKEAIMIYKTLFIEFPNEFGR
nr:uncharacterized protein LOC113801039 [Penaeus vannamei]